MNVYTHGDFDGIVSAAIVGRALPVARTYFASPKTIAAQTVTDEDVVCDLPYPHRAVRYWFDHHEANIEAVKALGLADSIDGRFVPAPSAAQVVYDFFRADHAFPPFLADTVAEANRVDAMDYGSVEEWLEPTPAHRINRALFVPNETLQEARRFMLLLARTIGKHPLGDLAESDEVEARYVLARRHEDESADVVRRAARLLGPRRDVLLLDFSEDRVPPRFSKNMAYVVHPEARAILHLAPGFKDGARANVVRVSLSVNPFGREKLPDVAAILGDLELGSGHKGAAGGTLTAESKERLRTAKDAMVAAILEAWEKRRAA